MHRLKAGTMKYKIIGLFLLVAHFAATAQDKPADFIFDSSGKLIGFPSVIVRPTDEICLKVIVPARFIFGQVKKFRDKLQRTYDSLNTQARYRDYECYFAKSSFDIKHYMDSLELLLGDLNDMTKLLTLASSRNELHKLDSFRYVPASLFLDNLFNNQFEIKVSSGSTELTSMKLEIKFDKKDSCFYFTDCQDLSKLTCKNCGSETPSQLTFDLVRTDPFSQTLKQWFEVRNDSLGAIDTRAKLGEALTDMAKADSPTANDFTTAHGQIKEIKGWFPFWFWFSGGELVLDPFRTVFDKVIDSLKEQVTLYAKQIDQLKQRKIFLDSVLQNVSYKLNRLALFEVVQKSITKVNNAIENITKRKKKDEKTIATKAIEYNSGTRVLLNSVPLFISYKNNLRPQHQLDAANKYRLVASTKREVHRVVEVPDNENPVFVLYNVDSAQKLEFKQAPADFSDEEEFTEIIREQLSSIDLASLTPATLLEIQDFFGSFSKKGVSKIHGGGQLLDPNRPICYDNEFRNPVYTAIKKIAEDYAAGRITVYYEKNIFTDDIPKKSVYYTLSEMDMYKGKVPYKDSVGIIRKVGTEDKVVGQTYIKFGKLRFVQLAAGIALTRKPAEIINVDTSGRGFRVSSSDNKARAVFGFKVYPFQHYTRDRWLIPRYPLHRISVFGGFELLKPFNNFYVGGCYDIVPGLGFSMGANYQLQTTYKIEDNTVVNTDRNYKSTGLYYSVMVNPKLFVQFIKLFFKAL
jgi:hypothetical protein